MKNTKITMLALRAFFILGLILFFIGPAAAPVQAIQQSDRLTFGINSYAPGDEVLELRTENSKTTYIGNGKYSLDVSEAPIFYKNNYSDNNEQWKPIDLTIVNGQITKAPYILTIDSINKTVTMLDKKTGDSVTAAVASVSSIIPDNANVRIELPHDSDMSIVKSKPVTSIEIREQSDADKLLPVEQQAGFVDIDNKSTTVFTRKANSTLNLQVGASTDDTDVYWNGSAWSMSNTDDLYVGYLVSAEYKAGNGMRFVNVTIPQATTINTAYLTFKASSSQSGVTVKSYITGQLGNSATFSTFADFQARRGTVVGGANNNNRTTTQVAFDSIASWTSGTSYNSPEIKTVIQEIVNGAWASGYNMTLFWDDFDNRTTNSNTIYRRAYSYDSSASGACLLHIEYTSGPAVTTQAGSSVEATTATGNGNITNLNGGANCSRRGICYSSINNPPTTADSVVYEDGSFGTGAYTEALTSLSTGTTYYLAAYAVQSGTTGYGSTVTILTKPAAPTSVAASDGTSSQYVTITWTGSYGATAYHIWKDGGDLGAQSSGYQDATAGAPTITAGTASATDGTSTSQVTLTVTGQSASNGASSTYYVVASNATGNSANSSSDTGYRGTTTLTYAWQVSSGVGDSGFGAIGGGTTNPYNYTSAPAPTITPGITSATDGTSTSQVTLSIAGATGNNGATRYYYCIVSMTGASNQNTTHDSGYTGITTLTYQWKVSAADSDGTYGNIGGATTAPYNYTSAPAPTVTAGTASASDGTSRSYSTLSIAGATGNNGAGRYYYCTISMTGASDAYTTHDRGYTGITTLTYQWWRSAADSDGTFGSLAGATTAPYNDTTGAIEPDGRYYYCVVSMVSAADQNTTHDRGNSKAFVASTVVTGACTGYYHTSAIINGTITAAGDAVPTIRGFDYGTTSSYGGSSVTTLLTGYSNEAYSAVITGLTPSTQYHYRAKAYNGAWGYGVDKIFSTTGSPAIEYYFQTTANNQTNIYGVNWAEQTFTTDNTTPKSVTSISLLLNRVGSPGSVIVSLRDTSDNVSTGIDLVSCTLDSSGFSTSATWYQFTMDTEKSLQINTKYAIVVSASSGDAANYIQWQFVNAGGYTGGIGATSVNSGLTWTQQAWDYNFEVWGNPSMTIQDVKVFQSFKNTGDWLIVVRYINTTAPYYDTYDVKKYFSLQFTTSTGTVIASTTLPAWGNKVGNIYMSAAQVAALDWGGSYRVRIYGLFTGNPYTEYALLDTDWAGEDLTQLDSWVLSSAAVLSTYYNTTMTTYIASRGEVLNATGGAIFSSGINGLGNERPDLFQINTASTTYNPNITPQTYRLAVSDWETNWGPDGVIMLNRIGGIIGMGGNFIASIFFVIIMIGLALFAFPAGHSTAANILCVPALIIGIFFGVDLIFLGILGIFAAFLLIKNMWLDK